MRVDSANEHHITQTWFAGEQGKTLASIGTLTTTVGEYQIIGAAMLMGAKQTKGHLIVINDDKAFVEFSNREKK